MNTKSTIASIIITYFKQMSNKNLFFRNTDPLKQHFLAVLCVGKAIALYSGCGRAPVSRKDFNNTA